MPNSLTSRSRQSRIGFTLVELLVVIAIIGILIALLLPAVQAARESARLSQCKNHLRQFGLAMHNYESSFRVLPAGFDSNPAADGNQAGHSWGTKILPFVELETVFDRIDFDLPVFDPVNQQILADHQAVFLCPSDDISPSGFITMPNDNGGTDNFAMGCYVANFGSSTESPVFISTFGAVADEDRRDLDLCRGGTPSDADECVNNSDGVFYRNSSTRLEEITDGLANTFMVGERYNILLPSFADLPPEDHLSFETTWGASVRDFEDDTDEHGHMTLFQTGHVPGDFNIDDRDVSSAHSTVANFLRCDGSVESVLIDIDYRIYAALGTRAGGEIVDN